MVSFHSNSRIPARGRLSDLSREPYAPGVQSPANRRSAPPGYLHNLLDRQISFPLTSMRSPNHLAYLVHARFLVLFGGVAVPSPLARRRFYHGQTDWLPMFRRVRSDLLVECSISILFHDAYTPARWSHPRLMAVSTT